MQCMTISESLHNYNTVVSEVEVIALQIEGNDCYDETWVNSQYISDITSWCIIAINQKGITLENGENLWSHIPVIGIDSPEIRYYMSKAKSNTVFKLKRSIEELHSNKAAISESRHTVYKHC